MDHQTQARDALTSDKKDAGQLNGSSSLTDFFMGKGPTPVLAETSLFGERWLPWLINEMQNQNSTWFDQGNGESRDDCIRLAFELTIAELSEQFGPNIQEWSWGKIHQLTFNHSLGSIAQLAAII